MKMFLLSLMFLFTCGSGFAQPPGNPQHFYYFGNRKVMLKESSERIYVRLPVNEVSAVKASMRSSMRLKEDEIQYTTEERFMIIRLSGADRQLRRNELLNYFRKYKKAEIVRPALQGSDGKDVVIDEAFYVKLKKGVTEQQFRNLMSTSQCKLLKKYDYDDRTYIIGATSANGYDGLKMANVFFESGLFEYAEPDFRPLDVIQNVPPPNDALNNLQWAHDNLGNPAQYNGVAGADLDVDEAWLITMGSPAIRIAVLDDGVQRNHPDLVNNIDPLGFGLTAANANTGDILSLSQSHGTSCAGIIAAEANNSIGVAGIAPLSKIIPVNLSINTSGTYGTASQIAQGFDWAWDEGGADILSNSWGGGLESSIVVDAIRRAVTLGRGGKGSIVVFASGNSDAGVFFPAMTREVIAVGAMSMCDQRKSPSSCDGETNWGSCYGTGLDISAPGVKIATTRNTGTGSGAYVDYNPTFNGTSSACPMVAGVAALVLSVNNNFTQEKVREIIERSARKAGSYTYSHVPGQPNGSWTSELGYGMVNAKNAVLAAQNPQYCRVEMAAPSGLQVCSGNSVQLDINNPEAGATYEWRLNGINTNTGTTFAANQTGNYDVIMTTSSGCKDTSYALNVVISSPQGVLTADAGADTTICPDAKIYLGGGPAGTGGTPILHPMRAIGTELIRNQLVRFNPQQPELEYDVVRENFSQGYSGSFSGAANTPFGLYMINRTDRKLVRVDTADGRVFEIGVVSSNPSLLFNGMTYDRTTGKIFAVATIGSSNQLFEINRLTGNANLLGTISGLPFSVTLVSLSADTSGQLYALRLRTGANLSAVLYAINKSTLSATVAGNTGFQASQAQGGDVDPVTNELYHFGITTPLGSSSVYYGYGLWKLNKANGAATLIGATASPSSQIDALSFSGPEYRYQWSPATHLSNPNDANPQFSATTPGTYTYTLTVTDLCGNSATDEVVIVVEAPPSIPEIYPATPQLSHRNEFTETLTYNQTGGINYQWLIDGVAQANTTNSFLIDYNRSATNQFAVRATDPVSGCVSVSNPVQFTYSQGVLLNSSAGLMVCDSSFYDGGGPSANTGTSFSRTFTPETPGSKLKLTLYNLQLSVSATLRIFDGPDLYSPNIAILGSNDNGTNKREFVASNPDGILTIYYSGPSSQGWWGSLTCTEVLEYQTSANGAWNSIAVWESKRISDPETAWLPATRLPNIGDTTITIKHVVTLTQEIRIDDIIVDNGARLEVNSGGMMDMYRIGDTTVMEVRQGGTLSVGSGGKLTGGLSVIEIKGTLENAGEITVERVVMNGTASQQLITGSSENYIKGLKLMNTAGLAVQGVHRIEFLELLDGLVNTSAGNTIELMEVISASASSYINGPARARVAYSERLFPIGKNGVYRPVSLYANASDNEGFAVIEAEVIPGAPPAYTKPSAIQNVSSVRYYKVSVVSNPQNYRDFMITLPYGTDDGVTDHNNLKIAKDDGAGGWIDLEGVASGEAPGTIQSNTFNTFSDFVLANPGPSSPMPVSLISFSGMVQNTEVHLRWESENEIAFDRYEIERSSDGNDFRHVGTVQARGSMARVHYQFSEEYLKNISVLYYRLKMVDHDGTFTYSDILPVKINRSGAGMISAVSPNPFRNGFVVHYESGIPQAVRMQLIDMQGRMVKHMEYKLPAGMTRLSVETGSLLPGIYVLKISAGDGAVVKKLIKQ